jgi:hypothetical protein
MKASQIHNEFIYLLQKKGERYGYRCDPWFDGSRRFSRNIVDLSGAIDCLIYFKIRSAEPHRWGVTANRIQELHESGRKWVVALLFESPHTGYLIASEQVKNYLSIWPLAQDGDYKVEPGTYLQFNKPYLSIQTLLDSIFAL